MRTSTRGAAQRRLKPYGGAVLHSVSFERLNSITRRFDINRSLRIFMLTLGASVVVTGVTAYLADTLNPSAILWRSLAIAAVVAAGAGWLAGDGVSRPAAPDAGRGGSLPDRVGAAGSTYNLEEQGLTTRLLELIALGDRYGNTFSLALISVDYLEDVREQYGTAITETLLDEVSNALAHTLRMPDRLGKFEYGIYLVVLPETTLPGAIQIAERLRTAVNELDIEVSPRTHIHTTASIGVTSFRRGDDLQGLLDRAYRTLRGAQKQGKNCVVPDMAA